VIGRREEGCETEKEEELGTLTSVTNIIQGRTVDKKESSRKESALVRARERARGAGVGTTARIGLMGESVNCRAAKERRGNIRKTSNDASLRNHDAKGNLGCGPRGKQKTNQRGESISGKTTPKKKLKSKVGNGRVPPAGNTPGKNQRGEGGVGGGVLRDLGCVGDKRKNTARAGNRIDIDCTMKKHRKLPETLGAEQRKEDETKLGGRAQWGEQKRR